MLRGLASAGFNVARQSVMMTGRTDEHEVTAIVHRRAIAESFPGIISVPQCVDFVERNLEPLCGMVKAKLRVGKMIEFAPNGGETALFVELTSLDVLRSKRWMTP
jgi:hypothetical protein